MSGYPPKPPRPAPRSNVARQAAAFEGRRPSPGARKLPPSPQLKPEGSPGAQRRSLNMPQSGNWLSVDTAPQKPRQKSNTTFAMLPSNVTRGEVDDIDWRIAKVSWVINQICNAPYLMTLAMCFTIPGSFNTKPLFDENHVTFFIWAMGLVIVNSWITGYVIFVSTSRTTRNIAWAQGASFIVMNLSVMMVVHNATFVDLERDRIEYIQWNVFYAGPPEVISQIMLWSSIMGFLSCKKCC